MTESERSLAIRFMCDLDEATCERREEFAGGVATLSDRELPRVPNMNLLRVESLPDRLLLGELVREAGRIAAEAERIQGRLGFRRVVAYDEEIGTRLALGFEQLEDWQTERVVLMAHHRPPDREVDSSFVREVDIEELEPVRARYLVARSGGDEELARQELAVARKLAGTGEMRFFAAFVEGEIGSFCELYSDDSGASVVRSVATLEEYRRAGLARATVSRAVQRSRALDSRPHLPPCRSRRLAEEPLRQAGLRRDRDDLPLRGLPRLQPSVRGERRAASAEVNRSAGARTSASASSASTTPIETAEEEDEGRGADENGDRDQHEHVGAGRPSEQEHERQHEEGDAGGAGASPHRGPVPTVRRPTAGARTRRSLQRRRSPQRSGVGRGPRSAAHSPF